MSSFFLNPLFPSNLWISKDIIELFLTAEFQKGCYGRIICGLFVKIIYGHRERWNKSGNG